MKAGKYLDSGLSRYSININLIIFMFLYAVIAYLIILKPIESYSGDYWMHAGSIEIFSQNLLNPHHTYDEAEAIRVRNFSPYQAILALLVTFFGLTPIDALTLGNLISVGFLFLGIWLMGSVLGTSPWTSSSLLIAILFFVGRGYDWSQEIYARILPVTGGYPSTVSIALSLICWYHVDRLLEQKALKRYFGVAVLIALIFLIHQLVFLHFSIFLFFWVALSTASLRNKMYIYSSMIAALILVLLWPYFSPFSVAYGAVTGAEIRPDDVYDIKMGYQRFSDFNYSFYSFSGAKKALGPALFGLLLLPALPSKIRLRLIFLVAFTLFMWFARVYIDIHIPLSGRRWATSSMLLLQFVIGIHIAKLIDFILAWDMKKIGRGILTVSTIAIVVIIILTETRQVWASYSRYFWPPHNESLSRIKYWERFSREAKRYIENDNPIAADVNVSFAMTAFQLQPVVFSRKKNPINTLLIRLYGKETSEINRNKILEDLGVQYFIIDSGRTLENVKKEMRSIGEEVVREADIILYKVNNK